MKRMQKDLLDAQMHLQLVEEAHAMVDEGNSVKSSSNQEKDCEWLQCKHMDIWNDEQIMTMLHGRQVLEDCNLSEISKIRKRILQYHWNHDQLMFKTLVVPKPKERKQIILDLHTEIGHFGEGSKLPKMNKCYYWDN